MKHIIVDPMLFEVSRAVDQEISTKVEGLASLKKIQRLVSALAALQRAGFAESATYDSQDIWMSFTKAAIAKMQLREFSLSQRSQRDALVPKFRFELELANDEFSASTNLADHYALQLDRARIDSSWRSIGALVGHTAKGDFRLIGPEAENGLIFEALTRSMRDQFGGQYFWFTLCERPKREPDPIDLKHDVELLPDVEEIIIRWPIR